MRAVVESARPVTDTKWLVIANVESETLYGMEYSVALVIEVVELREPRNYSRIGLSFKLLKASCTCRASAYRKPCKHVNAARAAAVEHLKKLLEQGEPSRETQDGT